MATGFYYTENTYTSFDRATAKITVEVATKWRNTETNAVTDISTETLIVTLPVDADGRVPNDPRVLDAIVQDRIRVRIGDVTQKIPPGGITNAFEIEYLTTDVEEGTPPPGMWWVRLDPDETTRDGMQGTVTRSVMTVITNRTDMTRPVIYGEPLGLDNGNIVYSTGLLDVRDGANGDIQAGPFEITAASDNTATVQAGAWVYALYPNYIDNSAGYPTFTGYQYVIEHDAIELTTFATALFSY